MIDPAATVRFTGQSAQVYLKSPDSLRSLTRGAAERVFVEKVGTGGLVVLRLGGRRVLATTLFPLRKGEWYIARPQEVSGRLSLRLESRVPRTVMAAEIARSAGLPGDAISEAVVRAFIRSGLPLLPDRLQRAYRKIVSASGRQGRDAKELARLEALAGRKGLVFDDDAWDIIGSYRGRSGPDGDPGGSHGRPSADGEGRRPSEGPNEGAVRRSFRLSGDANHPIQLFNHVVGDGDHWVVVPIATPGTNLRASLRIRIRRGYALGTDRGLSAVREAVLVVTDEVSRWLFGLQPTGTGLRVVLLSKPDGRASAPGVSDLAERLHDLGISFDREELSAPSDDGFSQADAPDIMTSVDSSV